MAFFPDAYFTETFSAGRTVSPRVASATLSGGAAPLNHADFDLDAIDCTPHPSSPLHHGSILPRVTITIGNEAQSRPAPITNSTSYIRQGLRDIHAPERSSPERGRSAQHLLEGIVQGLPRALSAQEMGAVILAALRPVAGLPATLEARARLAQAALQRNRSDLGSPDRNVTLDPALAIDAPTTVSAAANHRLLPSLAKRHAEITDEDFRELATRSDLPVGAPGHFPLKRLAERLGVSVQNANRMKRDFRVRGSLRPALISSEMRDYIRRAFARGATCKQVSADPRVLDAKIAPTQVRNLFHRKPAPRKAR